MQLNYKDIRDFVKKSYLSRGRDYFKKGVVEIKSDKDSCVKSEVAGTYDYQVVLKHNGQHLSGKCSCPAYITVRTKIMERKRRNFFPDLHLATV